jgi:hypothetical protein
MTAREMSGGDSLPLWTSANPQAERDIERLAPLARELARRAGARGITVADLRVAAERCGLLTGAEMGRRLSFLGSVMKAAGLRASGARRRSFVQRSHGNLHSVWVSAAASAAQQDERDVG